MINKAVGPTSGNARYLTLVVSISSWTVLLLLYTTATSLISLLTIFVQFLCQLKIKKGPKEATQLG
jgi:hypothetical protein